MKCRQGFHMPIQLDGTPFDAEIAKSFISVESGFILQFLSKGLGGREHTFWGLYTTPILPSPSSIASGGVSLVVGKLLHLHTFFSLPCT